jgi:hypothetical protein
MPRNRPRQHLAPVPPAGVETKTPPARVSFERLDLPTGGRRDVDGLLRELARAAFPKALVGFSFELDRQSGPRCSVTVATHDGFGPDQVDAGRTAITRCLLALGVLQAAKPAPEAKASPAPAEAEDGAQSPTTTPTPPLPSSPT